jgi:hypothetical protein
MLIEWAEIKTVVPCDFKNLPLLIFVCHVAMPLLCVPMAFLLPDLKIDDTEGALKLLEEDPTRRRRQGSLLRAEELAEQFTSDMYDQDAALADEAARLSAE